MSLTNPNKVITEQRLHEFYQGIYPYLNGSAHAGFTPVGTVISVMGNTAPTNYLACNGQTVNIADYPELANYFEEQFGTKNHFGGDGTTTFGIPDLRGEFLRGTGMNSHANSGNGANVGTHQAPTIMPNITSQNGLYLTAPDELDKANNNIILYNFDVLYSSKDLTTSSQSRTRARESWSTTRATGENTDWGAMFSSRPTNTSVLYCIATKNIYVDARFDYSTDEKVVGTWIDGKPVYQKTYVLNLNEDYEAHTSCTKVFDEDLTKFPIKAFGIYTDKNGRKYVSESFINFDTSTESISGGEIYIGWLYNFSLTKGHYILIKAGKSAYTCDNIIITLQYTKTTD